jgi:protocatechuate 3,4-dioxygenase beta subunit
MAIDRGTKSAGAAALFLALGILGLWLALRDRGASEPVNVERDAAGAAGRQAPPQERAEVVPTPEEPLARESVETPQAPTSQKAELATLEVRVLRRDTGRAIPDARVEARPRPSAGTPDFALFLLAHQTAGDLGQSRACDADGRVRLSLPTKLDWDVRVAHERLRFRNDTFEVASLAAGEERLVRIEVDVLLDREFWGRVVERDSGSPVPDADVHRLEAGEDPIRERLETADALGAFHLTIQAGESLRLLIRASGRSPVVVMAGEGFERPERALVIELERPAELRGVVLGADGAARQGAEISLWMSGASLLWPRDAIGFVWMEDAPLWRATTDAVGGFSLHDIAPHAACKVKVALDGRLALLLHPPSFQPGEQREVELRIPAAGALRGTVRDEAGAVVPSQEIWLQLTDSTISAYFQSFDESQVTASAVTNAAGRFEFLDLMPGTYRLGPAARGDAQSQRFAPRPIPVTIVPGERDLEVDLLVHRALTIEGRVVDFLGQPVPNCPVRCWNVEETGAWMESSDADGAFIVRGLAPGSYRLDAGELGFGTDPTRFKLAEAGSRSVVIRLPAAGELRGKVVDARGSLVSSNLQFLRGQQGNFHPWLATNSSGEFRVPDCPAGDYYVIARTPDGRFGIAGPITVDANHATDTLTVTLELGARLTILLPESTPNLQAFVAGEGIPYLAEIFFTKTTFTLPARNLSLTIEWPDGHSQEGSLSLAPGEERTILPRRDD